MDITEIDALCDACLCDITLKMYYMFGKPVWKTDIIFAI